MKLKEQLDALALALIRLPPGPFREDCCDKHRPEMEDARDDGLSCYGLYSGDQRVDPDPRALAPLLNAAPTLLALANAAITDWREGPPPGAGQFWVVMWLLNPDRWEVRMVEISPAVLNPEGRLLLKMSNGSAFLYEPNRYAISHHAPVTAPEPPVPLEGRAPPHDPEATRVHHTHSCQNPKCGLTWRPAVVPTVGVYTLPGFLNAEAPK